MSNKPVENPAIGIGDLIVINLLQTVSLKTNSAIKLVLVDGFDTSDIAYIAPVYYLEEIIGDAHPLYVKYTILEDPPQAAMSRGNRVDPIRTRIAIWLQHSAPIEEMPLHLNDIYAPIARERLRTGR